MKWLTFWKRRKAEEQEVDKIFKEQLAEALLRQNDLKEAALQMKRAREEQEVQSNSGTYRSRLASRPSNA